MGGIWDSIRNALGTIGRVFGIQSSEEPDDYAGDDPREEYDAQAYDQTANAEEELDFSDMGGGGSGYSRAGVVPRAKKKPRPQPEPPREEPSAFARPRKAAAPDNIVPLDARRGESGGAQTAHATAPGGGRMLIYCVRQKNDASRIIDNLMSGTSVMLNLESLDDVQCQRVIDMVSGASYALQGSIERVSHRNYLVVPSGTTVTRSEADPQPDDDGGDMRHTAW